jgi:hypothetical protein
MASKTIIFLVVHLSIGLEDQTELVPVLPPHNALKRPTISVRRACAIKISQWESMIVHDGSSSVGLEGGTS